MNLESCQREEELLKALGRGFVSADLDAHVADCTLCSELRLVAGALLDDRARAIAEAPVPASGTMWWRMRVRQRHDAEASARRTLWIGQAATLMIALVLVISLFGAQLGAAIGELVAMIPLSTPLLIAVATTALLAPIAGWVAIREK